MGGYNPRPADQIQEAVDEITQQSSYNDNPVVAAAIRTIQQGLDQLSTVEQR
ncbi:MAG TPA: hypothetical protein VE826_08400 [Dongiaceae bacterium]|nr:hypothetical protein [Dongiaceae bacterium]